MATVKETPLMAARDIVRSLSSAGKAFQRCQFARCDCGAIKHECRKRWEIWINALQIAENKLKKLDR